MRLDLRKEFDEVYRYFVDRVSRFAPRSNNGPGDGEAVTMIEVGYEYDQSAWVVLVFDTRPDAEPDGEWTLYIEGQDLARPLWLEAGLSESPVTLTRLDGSEHELDCDLAQPLGELLKEVALKARADGVFARLPKAPGCEFGVEHQCGAFGWPAYDDRKLENLA